MFPVLQGSADTQIRRGGKLYTFQLPTFCETFLPKSIKIQICILDLQLKILGILFYEAQRRNVQGIRNFHDINVSLVDAARIVCRAGSMKLSGVRLSVCLSVRPSRHSPAACATAGLLLSALPAEDIDRQRQRRSTAHSRKLRSAANASSVTLTADVRS